MVILSALFFASVLAVSVWAIVATLAPRAVYVRKLMTGEIFDAKLVPVAQRRRVSRLKPLSYRSELRMIRAAA